MTDSASVADQLGGNYFNAELSNRLLKALSAARFGNLTTSWRDELQLQHTGQHFMGDAEKLAVEEIRLMPPAAWEPGHSPGWRESLDAWYVCSRDMLTRKYAAFLRGVITTVGSPDARLLHAVRVRHARLDSGRNLDDLLINDLASAEQIADKHRRTFDGAYVQERDGFTASYLAGLAGRGATEIDWLQWYAQRVDSWPADTPGKSRGVIETRELSFKLLHERLPEYWG